MQQIPDAYQSAILLLMLIESRPSTTRIRLSEMTIKRVCGRFRLTDEFLDELKEWMFRAGWTLFNAGTTYAAVRMSVVENWPRLSSKRIVDTLEQVRMGGFDFDRHNHLIANPSDTEIDD